jgi:hypothetical protein
MYGMDASLACTIREGWLFIASIIHEWLTFSWFGTPDPSAS